MAYVHGANQTSDEELSIRFSVDVIPNDGLSAADLAEAINLTNPERGWRVTPSDIGSSALTLHAPLSGDYTRWGGVTRHGLDAASQRAVAASDGKLTVHVYTTIHVYTAEEVKGVLALFLVLQSHFQRSHTTTFGVPISASIAESCPGADSHLLTYQLDRLFEVTGESDRATISALRALVNVKPVVPGYQVDAPRIPRVEFIFRHHRATLDSEAAILWVNSLLKLVRIGRFMGREDIDDYVSRGIETIVDLLLDEDGLRRNGSDNSQNDSDADGVVRDESEYVEDPDSDSDSDSNSGRDSGSVGSRLEFLSDVQVELNDDSDNSVGSDGSTGSGGSEGWA